MAKKPIPTTEKPMAYSRYLSTPNKIIAAPIMNKTKDAQAKIVFLFIPIIKILNKYRVFYIPRP